MTTLKRSNKESGIKFLPPLRSRDDATMVVRVEEHKVAKPKDMKLLHCKECDDILRIHTEWRSCQCGKSKARYVKETIAQLSGPCRALGLDTKELDGGFKGNWVESERIIRKIG